MTKPNSEVEKLKKMLDPANWPVMPGHMFLFDGEVWSFESDDPEEVLIHRPLFEAIPDESPHRYMNRTRSQSD